MVQPVVIRAEQDQVVQVGGAAVLPVPQVVGVQAAGGSAAGDHTAVVAVLQGAAQPAADAAGGASRADDPCRGVGTTPHRWRHRSGIGGRPRRAADPGAARPALCRGRGAPRRWCAAPWGRRAASVSQPVFDEAEERIDGAGERGPPVVSGPRGVHRGRRSRSSRARGPPRWGRVSSGSVSSVLGWSCFQSATSPSRWHCRAASNCGGLQPG